MKARGEPRESSRDRGPQRPAKPRPPGVVSRDRAKRPAGRRRFLRAAVRALGGVALAAASLEAGRRFSSSRSAPPEGARGALGILRPPGAPGEREFLALCLRCTRCRDACRPQAIRLFPAGTGDLAGTPYIEPAVTACDLCLDCIAACPAGALGEPARKEEVRMGTARVDERLCVSHAGTGFCGACYTICPLKNQAITQNYRGAPEIHVERCTGCGLCEEVCIVGDPRAIRVVSERRWSIP